MENKIGFIKVMVYYEEIHEGSRVVKKRELE